MKIEYFPEILGNQNITDETIIHEELPRIEYREYNGRLIRGRYSVLSECKDVENFCLDVDKCVELGLNPFEYIAELRNRISVIIVSDIDTKLMRTINSIGFKGTLVINYYDKLRFVPSGMRKAYLKYVHSLGEYIMWAFSMDELVKKHDKRVLFGAGNMCRNYMLSYGKEYPPLFTCDNNSKRWGSYIDGLLINNPEELKKLDEDVAIYICNMYWDEVYKQLKDMGIKNPIERFNDDFLAVQHENRMELWKGNDL